MTTDSGKVVLDIPRDRPSRQILLHKIACRAMNGSFDPLLIAKYQRRFPEFDTKIISMHARGMTTRESEPLRRHWFEPNGERAISRRSTALRRPPA